MIDPLSRAKRMESRAARSARMREQWKDPQYRAQQSAKRSTAQKALWADPVKGEKRRAELVARNKTPEQRAASAAYQNKIAGDPAVKAVRAQRMKALQARPEMQSRTIEHARAMAHKINAERRARRDVIPPGLERLYRKLRSAGITRPQALAECWNVFDGSAI